MKTFNHFIIDATENPKKDLSPARATELKMAKKAVADASRRMKDLSAKLEHHRSVDMGGDPSSSVTALEDRLNDLQSAYYDLVRLMKSSPKWSEVMAAVTKVKKLSRSSLGEATTPLFGTDPRDKFFEKLKKLKGVTYQGRGFYIIPAKLLEGSVGILRYRQVKQRTNRYELTTMGDLMGWQHPQANDYRLKDWEEAMK
jgi:hypothetical protein